MVTLNVSLAVKFPPSVTVTVIVVLPNCPETGTSKTLRILLDPLNAMFAFGINEGLLDWAVKTKFFSVVSTSLTLNVTGPIGPVLN